MGKLRLSAIILVLAAALLAACGSSGNGSHSNASTAAARTDAVSPTAAKADAAASQAVKAASASTQAVKAPAAGKKLSDCDYATTFVKTLNTFATSLPDPSSIANTDAAAKAYSVFADQLTALINQLQSYQLSPDIAKLNAALIAVFANAQGQLPALESAIQAGDVAKLTASATTLQQTFGPGLDAVQQSNQATVTKLNKCVKS